MRLVGLARYQPLVSEQRFDIAAKTFMWMFLIRATALKGEGRMATDNGFGHDHRMKAMPIRAYHGTADFFEKFDYGHGGKASGASDTTNVFWFAANPLRANAAARDASIVKNDRSDMEYEEGANVMPVYLYLQRLKQYAGLMPDLDKSAKQIANAQAKGFDGVVWELGERMNGGIPSGPVYAVFDPELIKSIFHVGLIRDSKSAGITVSGHHHGRIEEVLPERAVQHVGRGIYREHELTRLDRIPSVGEVATISYKDGYAKVWTKSELAQER